LEIIEDNGYLPEQVFNADELAMFWKQMLTRIFISKEEQHASDAKAAKDHQTMLFWYECCRTYDQARLSV